MGVVSAPATFGSSFTVEHQWVWSEDAMNPKPDARFLPSCRRSVIVSRVARSPHSLLKLPSKVKEMSQINRRHTITASEVGEFAFCAKAWYLNRCGEVAQSPHLEEGVAFHETHEAGVSQAVRLNRAGKKLGVIALILLIVMAFIRFAME